MRLVLPLALLLVACAAAPPSKGPMPTKPPPAAAAVTLDGLREGSQVRGFSPAAVYVDDEGNLRGARFVHGRTKFIFDYLRVESAAQALVFATTYPASDGGEPHTQEHLLLGRGNKGRTLGNFEHAMLGQSSAFTAQTRTVYTFHTMSGPQAFWPLLRTHMDALLHPDYTDEEVRREVRDFGVSKGHDGVFSLQEKGTVYNEMVNRSDDAGDRTWYGLTNLLHGVGHPLANMSGGTPEGIRTLTPEKIRAFHAAHYRLGNMGMIAALPSSVSLEAALDGVGEMLDAMEPPTAATSKVVRMTEADLPASRGAAAGEVRVVDYPSPTADHPVPMRFAWSATRPGDLGEKAVLDGFLGAFGGGPGSTLYSALVDRTSRALDVGATGVWAWRTSDPGNPVMIAVEDVGASHADAASVRAVRAVVVDRLKAIAALADGSNELAAFQERYKSRLIDDRRWIDKFLDTPPEFGLRSTGDAWLEHLYTNVGKEPGFRRSLGLKDAFDHAFTLAGSTTNPWRERLAAWGLLGDPYGVVARPSPALRNKLDDDRSARVAAELARLQAVYGTSDPQTALGRRAAEIAAADEEIARAEAAVPLSPFVSDPPMTNDDTLSWKTTTVGGVPVVATTFETMKSATVGIALRLDALPEELLPYASILPSLIQDVGLVRDGVPVPYDVVRDRLRREVLGIDVRFDVSFSRKRAELVLEASGNDVDETRRALGWLRDFLTTPDWRPENLPRIRDVVNQETKRQHDVMSSPEEYWAKRVAAAYWQQDQPLLAHTGSFLTRAHDALRLSYLLDDGGDAKELGPFLRTLAGAGKKGKRADLAALAVALASADGKGPRPPAAMVAYVTAARALSPASRPRAEKVGHDLGELLVDLPDDSLAADWSALVTQMEGDFARPPSDTLTKLATVLRTVRHANLARAWTVGSTRHQAAIRGELQSFLASLDPSPAPLVRYAPTARVVARARARGVDVQDTTIAALVDAGRTNASLIHSAPAATYRDPTDAALVDYLAANVYNGTGGHSFYKRIWGAGLAYSGYASTSPGSGRFELYSDRCADLAGLLRFVDGDVRHAPEPSKLVDYVVTTAFMSRVADAYEGRARAIAGDLAVDDTPDRIRAFRARLLALRKDPNLPELLRTRLVPVYGQVIPSLAPSSARAKDSLLFAIGSERHVAAYERELAASLGPSTRVLRLAPRDFW